MKEYTLTDIANHLKIPFYIVKAAVRKLNLTPISVHNKTNFYSKEQRKELIWFIKKEYLTIYKPVYIHSENLIIPSKINFLTLEQL